MWTTSSAAGQSGLQVRTKLEEKGIAGVKHSRDGRLFEDMEAKDAAGMSAEEAHSSAEYGEPPAAWPCLGHICLAGMCSDTRTDHMQVQTTSCSCYQGYGWRGKILPTTELIGGQTTASCRSGERGCSSPIAHTCGRHRGAGGAAGNPPTNSGRQPPALACPPG